MIRMVAHAEFVPYDRGDALGGPDLTDEAEGFGSPGQQTGELCELLGAQPRRGSRGRLAVQGFGASLACPLQPVADRTLGNAQGVSDGRARPALLMEGPRPQPAPFAPVPRRARLRCTHAPGVPQPAAVYFSTPDSVSEPLPQRERRHVLPHPVVGPAVPAARAQLGPIEVHNFSPGSDSVGDGDGRHLRSRKSVDRDGLALAAHLHRWEGLGGERDAGAGRLVRRGAEQ
jgi:hypothetical protein